MIKILGQCKLHQSRIDFLEVHSQTIFFSWHFIRFIFDTFIICVISIVFFLWNSTRTYTWCTYITKFFTPEERLIVNWFQFRIPNIIKCLVSKFYLELVSRRTEWILLAVSYLWVYPLNIFTMQSKPPIIPIIIGLTKLSLNFYSLICPFFLNLLLLIGGRLAFTF